ncbi:hypothetical protein JW998_05185 [candidate division KSB1 bacterium]|nr:hypothetical protein [candidate division KSB1 bacterium]
MYKNIASTGIIAVKHTLESNECLIVIDKFTAQDSTDAKNVAGIFVEKSRLSVNSVFIEESACNAQLYQVARPRMRGQGETGRRPSEQ